MRCKAVAIFSAALSLSNTAVQYIETLLLNPSGGRLPRPSPWESSYINTSLQSSINFLTPAVHHRGTPAQADHSSFPPRRRTVSSSQPIEHQRPRIHPSTSSPTHLHRTTTKKASLAKSRQKEIEAQLAELSTTSEKLRYLSQQKAQAQSRVQQKVAKVLARNPNAKKSKPDYDEKLLVRITKKMRSLEEGEDGDPPADNNAPQTGGQQKVMRAGDGLSYE